MIEAVIKAICNNHELLHFYNILQWQLFKGWCYANNLKPFEYKNLKLYLEILNVGNENETLL